MSADLWDTVPSPESEKKTITVPDRCGYVNVTVRKVSGTFWIDRSGQIRQVVSLDKKNS